MSSSKLPVWLPLLSQTDLLRWLKGFTESSATVFDKAMDAEYLRTHMGGYQHRLFDGGHSPLDAWAAVCDTLPDDTFAQEVASYAGAMWKDVSTPMGIPFATWDKDTWSGVAAGVDKYIPGASKEWFYDLCSFDTFEVLAAGLGVVSAVFAFKRQDQEQLAQIIGAMGINSIIAANPIAGIATIVITAMAYKKKRAGAKPLSLGILKGAGKTIVVSTVISVVGLPLIIELVLLLVVYRMLLKSPLSINTLKQWVGDKMSPQVA